MGRARSREWGWLRGQAAALELFTRCGLVFEEVREAHAAFARRTLERVDGAHGFQTFYFTEATGLEILEPLPGYVGSRPATRRVDMTEDGSVIVGYMISLQATGGFRFTKGVGSAPLTPLDGYNSSRAADNIAEYERELTPRRWLCDARSFRA